MERGEGEVLELPLDRVDPEPVGKRREDVERLLGDLVLLLLAQWRQRAHVVEPVRKLDQDHPDVARHRDEHLAVVLGLVLVAALECDAGQLRDAVHELGDLVSECGLDVVERCARVLDGVVEQRRAERLGVEPHARADLRHADRMRDELLARLAPLVGVPLAGEDECIPDLVEVDGLDRVDGVLGDHREEVGEQLALVREELLLAVRERLGRSALGGAVLAQADPHPRPRPAVVFTAAFLARLLDWLLGPVLRRRGRASGGACPAHRLCQSA